jgi:hypothetical protein
LRTCLIRISLRERIWRVNRILQPPHDFSRSVFVAQVGRVIILPRRR